MSLFTTCITLGHEIESTIQQSQQLYIIIIFTQLLNKHKETASKGSFPKKKNTQQGYVNIESTAVYLYPAGLSRKLFDTITI